MSVVDLLRSEYERFEGRVDIHFGKFVEDAAGQAFLESEAQCLLIPTRLRCGSPEVGDVKSNRSVVGHSKSVDPKLSTSLKVRIAKHGSKGVFEGLPVIQEDVAGTGVVQIGSEPVGSQSREIRGGVQDLRTTMMEA